MNLTTEEIVNEIVMKRVSTKEPLILVEGPSDVLFFTNHMTLEIENIIPTFGWEQLTEAIEILNNEGLLNILGIIDLDYRGIVECPDLPDNVITTDTHDIETMMFDSPAFLKVLRQKGSINKIRSYAGETNGVKKTICAIGNQIGSVRFYSQKKGKRYSFDRLDFEKFIIRITLSFSIDKFVSHLRGISSSNGSVSIDTFDIALKETGKHEEHKDFCRLCCGHDLMEIMAIGLKRLWGSYSGTEISGALVEEAFRLAYSNEMFHTTNLYKHIYQWFQRIGYESQMN